MCRCDSSFIFIKEAIAMDWKAQLGKAIDEQKTSLVNPDRETMIRRAVEKGEALVAASGCLATWTPPESTGRSPKDTVIVRHPSVEENIDWTSPNNLPLDPETFELIFEDACSALRGKEEIYITQRVVGADSRYALPVKTITDNALSALFTDNMFRPVPGDMEKSVFFNKGYTLLALPYDKLDPQKYAGRLRTLPDGSPSTMVVAMDFERRLGIIMGSAYMGSIKKMIFTVMNYYLPLEGILPLHCSANEGTGGETALLLGLSGTGKTTLSADPSRALLGDDEHGWSREGIANFEYGCYAKMININKEKEPEIYRAVNHADDYLKHGAIVENAMIYPDGLFDYDDERLTPNSRASYPLRYLTNIKESSVGGHPATILFLTADAYGVLPPVSRLNKQQAMLWFLMGYTSKLAGTETGVVEPEATFSRFFGQPFMPARPHVYASMLGEKMDEHRTSVFLVNTGWTGGSYGTGKRIDLKMTRAMVNAALTGALDEVDYKEDPLFHLSIPCTCQGVPETILDPKNTWADKKRYEETAVLLAGKFKAYFDKAYGGQNIDPAVAAQCPGK